MEPDKYQQAWQQQTSETRVTVDADLLLEAVRRNQHNFQTAIFWRDVTEIVVGLLLIPLWFYLGHVLPLPWTWWLTVPVLVWMIGFMIVYRRRHKPKPTEPDQSLVDCAQHALTDLEAQIWLLRTVFWWYLLPPSVSISAFFIQVGWSLRAFGGWAALAFTVFLEVFLAVVYGFLYFVNQYAVHAQFEPKRRELLALMASLKGEPTSEVTGQYPILMSAKDATVSRRRRLLSVARALAILVAVLTLMAVIVGLVTHGIGPPHEFPWKSPFAAVRWQGSQPEVQIGDEWFKLVSLDGIPAPEIVAFSRRTYGNKWQMRFEEDLVELLNRMGHPPKDTVTLVVQSLTSSQTRTLTKVPMTEANRRAIKAAAEARKTSQP